jgi:hypothetical protein
MDAFPIGISPQPLSWQDEGFHRVTVQFAYQRYRVVYLGNYDVAGLADSIFGAKVAQLIGKAGQNLADSIAKVGNKLF